MHKAPPVKGAQAGCQYPEFGNEAFSVLNSNPGSFIKLSALLMPAFPKINADISAIVIIRFAIVISFPVTDHEETYGVRLAKLQRETYGVRLGETYGVRLAKLQSKDKETYGVRLAKLQSKDIITVWDENLEYIIQARYIT